MKILNLVSLDESDVYYEISRFPDGQQNIVISPRVGVSDGVSNWTEKLKKHKVKIASRLNNFRDLELIICAVASLREIGIEEIHLYTPYIMGARSDRKFEEGGNNYLKDVICPIINSLNFKTVTCIDPHSDVLEACIKRFRKVSNSLLVDDTISRVYGDSGECKWEDRFILVSPDAGATKKIFKLAEQLGYKGDILTCSKDRDVNGNLTKTVVPLNEFHFGKDLIIIDDICDGGRTFINIAARVKEIYEAAYEWKGKQPKIYLIVTHGIFSNGFEELGKYFDGIYCTNSYSDIAELTTAAINQPIPTKVKQLKVF